MIRVVQFIVQPVLVDDDGETLTPLQVQPITVSAAEWPQFSGETWPAILAQQQRQ
jgi:hypothetical protein